jgi:hypothetical protein
MACEIGVEIAVSRISIGKGLEYLRDILFENYSLMSERTRKIFNALTGEEAQQMPFWPDFKASVELRNKTVHRWRDVTREEAEKAHRAASGLLVYLKKWARDRASPLDRGRHLPLGERADRRRLRQGPAQYDTPQWWSQASRSGLASTSSISSRTPSQAILGSS